MRGREAVFPLSALESYYLDKGIFANATLYKQVNRLRIEKYVVAASKNTYVYGYEFFAK